MIIFGTAGHIDHGKTTLIQAITGIDADRLPEEKERGMTIDLGFAWLEVENGEKIGIIDVPGHENFIRNTIIGLTSVDAFILVVDAKEGWKPQTEEHFQIIRLLGISQGIIAITKADLVSQKEIVQVQEVIQNKISNSDYFYIPVLSFSSKDADSIAQLKKQIAEISLIVPAKKNLEKPRLFIDRVFDIKGSGTVVTGTLLNGNFSQNQYAQLFPLKRRIRLRQLQSYGVQVEKALLGSRVAINISGAKKEEINRGDLIYSGQPCASGRIIDAELILPQQKEEYTLKNGFEVDFISHTKLLRGRVILPAGSLNSGEKSFVQIRFPEDLSLMIGDYFIIRLPGVNKTLGGGRILDPLAFKHSFKKKTWQDWLTKRKTLEVRQVILTEIEKYHLAKQNNFLANAPFSAEEITQQILLLHKTECLILLADWIVEKEFWSEQIQKITDSVKKLHQENPFQESFPIIQVKNYLPDLTDDFFAGMLDFLAGNKKIKFSSGRISGFEHSISLTNVQKDTSSRIIRFIEEDPQRLPTRKLLEGKFPLDSRLIKYLLDSQKIIVLEDDIMITPAIYRKMKDQIVQFLQQNGSINIGQVRDLLNVSRKYIVPLLTKMDQEGITVRKENQRFLRK